MYSYMALHLHSAFKFFELGRDNSYYYRVRRGNVASVKIINFFRKLSENLTMPQLSQEDN